MVLVALMEASRKFRVISRDVLRFHAFSIATAVLLMAVLLSSAASQTSARMSQEEATHAALSVCEDMKRGNEHVTFRAVIDCTCVASKATEAYLQSKISRIDYLGFYPLSAGCPQGRERLVAFYREYCFVHKESGIRNSANYREWAFGGGCECRANNSASRFLSDPAVGNWQSAYAVFPECGERIPDNTPRPFRAAPDFGKPDVVDPKFTLTFDVPAGIRPFELWHLDGRPIQGFPQRSIMDRIMTPVAQYKEMTRYINLLLLMDEPDIVEKVGSAPLALALQNLPSADIGRFLKGCSQMYAQPGHCSWVDDAQKQIFMSQFVPKLKELAAKLPREFVFSETMQIRSYDPARRGFPVSNVFSAIERYGFQIGGSNQGDSLFGPSAAIFATRQDALELTFWPVEPEPLKEVLAKLSARAVVPTEFDYTVVVITWRYKINGFRVPPGGGVGRQMVVELLDRSPTLFADATLTNPLGQISLDKPGTSPR